MSLFVPLIFLFNKNFFEIILDSIYFISDYFFFMEWKKYINFWVFCFSIRANMFKKLYWFDKSETRRSNAKSERIENEAWTKGLKQVKKFSEFISSNDWIKFGNNHGVKIMKKFLFFMFLSFVHI